MFPFPESTQKGNSLIRKFDFRFSLIWNSFSVFSFAYFPSLWKPTLWPEGSNTYIKLNPFTFSFLHNGVQYSRNIKLDQFRCLRRKIQRICWRGRQIENEPSLTSRSICQLDNLYRHSMLLCLTSLYDLIHSKNKKIY